MAPLDGFLEDLVAGIDAAMLFSPGGSLYESFVDADPEYEVVVVSGENAVGAETFLELPLEFENVRDRIHYAIEGAMEQDYLEEGDVVACVANVFDSDPDALFRVRVEESVRGGVYDLFVNSRAEPSVIRNVFEVAIELGKKGQKGKPVGALFVVGDAGKVMNKSRPLSYNPFEKSHVHVGDPIVDVMLKEFSRLDGAFVISDSGKIVSAYRYLEPAAEGVDIPKGLGARHMAAGAITRDTNATAIVLSESDGLVRAFKGGRLVMEIDPEDY